ncbi:bifunctional glycosyltransferase/CDP-glycerol:glycerophosphate glycerophosphotransferase [Streptomyces sp. NBC_01304]|uniref:bifunctional glycosyltransferase/CDP-glycerol:glycerophosphate glycerophosphotransferase n=1 Tax=Streptomyces sp. NBC_01304 TaxID=2903818 RepID=UPI002E15AC9E|nr:bifunctional glycosyltransferase family 2 protein/CDP-glycerol:glycerophosphate glycerophosphotransferase [Streptomyces sp. NBC_01304]
MPRFSIVVPVFKVQGYLRECLDSVLGQSFRDIEVIAVDDCSPDACGAIIDEYAARDSRVVPVHLAENGGLGRARNAGLTHATGEYVLFLDSDDTYTPGLLQALADRLDASGDLDILVFDHVRTYWWGNGGQSDAAHLLEKAGTDSFRIEDAPEYLNLFLVAWNKAFRREFFLEQGLQYAPGLYEDAPVTYEAMVTAERIGCLNRVGVEYRQRRQGAITKTPGRKHFDIFRQYEGLFAFIEARPELAWAQPLLFERALDHILFALVRPERVMPADRKEFFARAVTFYGRHLPAGFTPDEGDELGRVRLLARGNYRAFQANELLRQSAKSGLKKVTTSRNKLGKRAYQSFYALQRRRPLDENLAVYSAYWNRLPSCNPLAIYQEAKELAPGVHGVWVVKKALADQVPAGIDFVVPGSRRYWEVMARAKYFVNNVNFPDNIVKRPGQVHLQTHHGTPLKRMGIDQKRFPASAKGMSFARLLARADRWDFSVSANQHTTENWERVYPSAFESVDAGYPRNDAYYRTDAEGVAAIREKLGIAPGKTVLLYAPTHRDYRADWTPSLDLARLGAALGDDYVILARTHYFYGQDRQLEQLAAQGALVDVSQYPVVEELCLAADALIADYSSIMFDYANLDRPIVTYADDWDVYAESRGVTFDLLSGNPGDTPGVVATTEDELIEAFRNGSWRGEAAAGLRAAFRERFCQYDDGRAAERVVRRVLLGQEMGPAVLPLADRTPAPAPGPDGLGLLPGPRGVQDVLLAG